jgi:hypothetical protein
MDLEATAQALVPEAAPAAEVAPVEATPSEDDAYSAAYDKAAGDEEITDEPVVEEEPEPVVEEVQAPTDMPAGVRTAWAKLTPEERDAITGSQRDLHRKLADQGRIMSGINPIKDALVKAAQEMPNLAGMKPEQVAQEVFALAKVSRDFTTKPVETMMGLIRQHNLGPQIAAQLGAPEAKGAGR